MKNYLGNVVHLHVHVGSTAGVFNFTALKFSSNVILFHVKNFASMIFHGSKKFHSPKHSFMSINVHSWALTSQNRQNWADTITPTTFAYID